MISWKIRKRRIGYQKFPVRLAAAYKPRYAARILPTPRVSFWSL
jgi:hypothetical protein